MLIKRLIVLGVAVATAVVVTGLVAGAQANGTAKTHLGFAVAYAANADLTGSFQYRPTIAGVNLNIQCSGFTRYIATVTNRGVPKSIFNATNCFDAGGVQYYIHGEGTDPGAKGDTLSITVKTFPAKQSPWTFKDSGTITAGNVLIRSHPDNTIVDDGSA